MGIGYYAKEDFVGKRFSLDLGIAVEVDTVVDSAS